MNVLKKNNFHKFSFIYEKKPRFFKFVFMVSFICLFTIQGNAAS